MTESIKSGDTGTLDPSEETSFRHEMAFARFCLLASAFGIFTSVWLGWPDFIRLCIATVLLITALVLGARWRHKSRGAISGTSKIEEFPSRFSALLNSIPDPILVLDNRSLVVFANRAAILYLPNCKENNPLSFALRDPLVLAAVEKVSRGSGPVTANYHERVPVDRFFEVIVSPIPLLFDKNLLDKNLLDKNLPDKSPLTGTSAIRAPFSPMRENAIILMRDVTQLQRAEHMRVDFVANASHELRTPLASVIGFIETLQGPAKNDVIARGKFLGIMGEQARRMSRLVDDLLSLSRIELSQHVLPSDHVDIISVIRQIADTLSGLARARQVEIAIDPGTEETILVKGDRDELLRVFENLIENAIKYGQSGKKVMVKIRRSSRKEDHKPEVEIRVTDFGPGIAPEHVPRLTERFYRVDVGTSREQGGTGLGLAIVKHIVNRHLGRMRIESQLGEGASFIVNFPI